jgi:hypothetical protein
MYFQTARRDQVADPTSAIPKAIPASSRGTSWHTLEKAAILREASKYLHQTNANRLCSAIQAGNWE